MLLNFVNSNRDELAVRCERKAASRCGSSPTPAASSHGVPLFLQQLVDVLRVEPSTSVREPSGSGMGPAISEVRRAAAIRGAELLRMGFTVDQVVREYGDICQSITDLAVEQNATISVEEFRTLNRCLDEAIADAVTSFGAAGRATTMDRADCLSVSLSAFAEEHQRLVDIAIDARAAIRAGYVGSAGATGAALDQTLLALRYLVGRALPAIRLASAMTTLIPDFEDHGRDAGGAAQRTAAGTAIGASSEIP